MRKQFIAVVILPLAAAAGLIWWRERQSTYISGGPHEIFAPRRSPSAQVRVQLYLASRRALNRLARWRFLLLHGPATAESHPGPEVPLPDHIGA